MSEISISKKMFGKEVLFILYDIEEILAKELIEEAYSEGLRLQKIFNFFDEKSSLSILNKKRKMRMPKEFLEVLKLALDMCERTNGKYDVSLGQQFLKRKKGEEIGEVSCSYKDIKINEEFVELTHKDVLIDLGSIAKGYIGDKMCEFLISKGVISGLIDARGDIRVFGEVKEIKIQHPREKDKFIEQVKVKNCGIATSGDYNQYDKTYDKSHILNKGELISVTVIAPSLVLADIYASGIIVSSEKEVNKLLDKNKEIKALCINKDLKIKKYNDF